MQLPRHALNILTKSLRMTAIDMSELSFEVASSEICQSSQRSSNGVSTGNSERLSLAMQNLKVMN